MRRFPLRKSEVLITAAMSEVAVAGIAVYAELTGLLERF
jgi:hypothetical protein